MFEGYYQLGGKELINVARTEAYVKAMAPNLPLKPCMDCGDLREAVGDSPYESPLVDDAPWYDPNQPETNGFFGFYPLEINGLYDSSRAASIIESNQDGGTIGQARFGTKSIRFRGVLAAADELALEAGMAWLRSALTADQCTAHGGSCGGAMLCYYAACPCLGNLFTQTYQAGSTIPVSPTTGLDTIQDLRSVTGIWKAQLTPGSVRDGIIVRWGTQSTEDGSELSSYGPVVLRRTNRMTNPSFSRNLSGWTDDAATTVTRETVDGFDDTGFARVTPTAGTTTRRNYIGDPGFENIAAADRGIESGTDQVIETGQSLGAWEGENYIAQQPTATPTAFLGEQKFHDFTIPILGPETPAAGTVSIYLRTINPLGSNHYYLQILDADGAVVSSSNGDFPNDTTWQRYNVSGNIGEGYKLRVILRRASSSPISTVLLADGAQAEVGGVATSWFSGDLVDIRPAVASWEGTVDDSASILTDQFTGAVLQRNMATDPRATKSSLDPLEIGFQQRSGLFGPGGAGTITFLGGGTPTGAPNSYIRQTWTTASSSSSGTGWLHTDVGASGSTADNNNPPISEGQYVRATVWIRPSVNKNIQLRARFYSASGSMISEEYSGTVATIAGQWSLLEILKQAPANAVSVSIETNVNTTTWAVGNTLDGTGLLFMIGDTLDDVQGNYFDGSGTGTSSSVGTIYTYEGTPNSVSVEQVSPVTVFTSSDMSADFGPGGVSMKMRSTGIGTVVSVSLRSVADDSIYTNVQINPTADWLEYSFGIAGLNETYLELRAVGPYDVDQVIAEIGLVDLPYFDGDTTDPDVLMAAWATGRFTPEYDVEWIGDAVDGPSRMTWLGTLDFGIPLGIDYGDTEDGVCDAVPFLDVQQGVLSGMLDVAVRTRIPNETQLEPYERYMHDVACIDGPRTVRDYPTKNGAMREVEFTLAAGVPHIFGNTQTAMFPTVMSSLPTAEWVDPPIVDTTPAPILDPDCPPVPTPPRPPAIPNACVTDEETWQRYWLDIPVLYSSVWSAMVPAVTISTGAEEIRQVRVRVFPNPFDRSVDVGFRANVAQNPALKVTANQWSNLNNVGTATGRVVGVSAHCGQNFYRATATGSHVATDFGPVNSGIGFALVSPGDLVRPSIYARSSAARGIKMRYAFLDASNAVIGSVQYGPVVVPGANAWVRLGLSSLDPLVAPAGTVRMSVGVVGDSTPWVAGNTLDAHGTLIEVSNVWDQFVVSNDYWDAERLNIDCSPMAPDGFYYTYVGESVENPSLGMLSPVDPGSWCSEFVLSYLPPHTELTVDALTQTAYASVAGGEAQTASALLYGSDGGPMTWPALTCGIPYILTIDVPEPLLDDVTVGVDLTRREEA